MPKTSAFTSEMMFMPSGTPFRGTDLQRRYRAVLDSARHSPVTLVDSDGHRLAVADWDEMSTAWTFMRLLDAVAQFHAAWEGHMDDPPSDWVQMTPFPFLACFDSEEVEEFSGELLPYLMESVRRRDFEGFLGNLRAWESSAETLADKEIMAQMQESFDDSDLIELPRPA